MTKKILTHIDDDGNATLVLNRPEVHNALDPEMMEGLASALAGLEANERVRAVVLVGSGGSFCAGADIAHMKESARHSRKRNHELALQSAHMFHALYTLGKPTIACVRGAVRGGGCGLVAACDIAIASRLSTFRFSEAKLGIIPAMISPYVVEAIGSRMARRYMLTGEEIDSAEAYRTGLIHAIVEDDVLNNAVGVMLAHLYSSAPGAMRAIKALIPLVAHEPVGEEIAEETARRIADIRVTPEAQEGLAAFLGKRKPAWVSAPAAPKRTARPGRRSAAR
jgi:methylglutaconyl-CoA hydratase